MRTFTAGDFPPERVLAQKRGRRVSVCLPARNEVETIGETVESIRSQLMEQWPIVDEVLVVDDSSTDGTAAAAVAAGAIVVKAQEILPEYGTEAGKGQAMWKAVHRSRGDVVVFCDADIRGFDHRFVLGLVGPVLAWDEVVFAKGCYERPLDGRDGEGGRVTELMARPLISVFFPHLAGIRQPLAGECAARREIFEAIPFVGGYGVDLGLLIDVAETFGVGGIIQCDLGRRVHRNRPLAELSVQALAVLQVALQRAGLAEDNAAAFGWTLNLLRPGHRPEPVRFAEQPPLLSVPAHRKSA
jgi:glucosyl-3-phosphoglycerate synthase